METKHFKSIETHFPNLHYKRMSMNKNSKVICEAIYNLYVFYSPD